MGRENVAPRHTTLTPSLRETPPPPGRWGADVGGEAPHLRGGVIDAPHGVASETSRGEGLPAASTRSESLSFRSPFPCEGRGKTLAAWREVRQVMEGWGCLQKRRARTLTPAERRSVGVV